MIQTESKILNAFSATYYPDTGAPIPGTITKNPDGTTTFKAFSPSAIPPESAPMPGLLKSDSNPDGSRGVLKPTSTPGEGIFVPESGTAIPATFYPEDGSEPIPGTLAVQPDGTSTFTSYIPNVFAKPGVPIKGTVKTNPTDGSTSLTKRGNLTPIDGSHGTFVEDPVEQENGSFNNKTISSHVLRNY